MGEMSSLIEWVNILIDRNRLAAMGCADFVELGRLIARGERLFLVLEILEKIAESEGEYGQ